MPAQTEIIDMLTELANVGTVGLLSPAVDLAASFAGGKELKRYLDGSALMNMNGLFRVKERIRSLSPIDCAKSATPLPEKISARFLKRTNGKYDA